MKKILLGIVLGFVLAVGASALNASEIDYNDTKLDLVLDDLYTKANAPITFGTPVTSETLTTMSMDERSQTIELSAGKYLLTAMINYTWLRNGTLNDTNSTSSITILGTHNPTIRRLSCRTYRNTGTTAYSNNNYVADHVHNCIYYVELSEADTLSFKYKDSGQNNTNYPYIVAFQAVPIN